MRKILYVLTLVFIILICSDAKAQLIGEGDTLWCKQLNNIQQILYSPDGTKLGVISDSSIIIFNSNNGAELLRIKNVTFKFQFSHDGKLLYYINEITGNLIGCDVETGEIKEEYSLKFNDTLYGGDLYLTKNPDLLLIYHFAAFNKRKKEIFNFGDFAYKEASSPNSDYIIGSNCYNGDAQIYLLNVNTPEIKILLGNIEGYYFSIRNDVSMSYDGKYAASITSSLIIWELENKVKFKTLPPDPFIDSIISWSVMLTSAFTHKNDMIVVIGGFAGNLNKDYPYAMLVINFKNDKMAIIYPAGIYSTELGIRTDDKSLAYIGYDTTLKSQMLTVIKLKTDALSDVEENSKDINTLSPNPTTDFIYLPNTNDIIQEAAIYSIFGEKVLQFNDFQSNTIDISGLSKGVYFLRINNKSYKFVKI